MVNNKKLVIQIPVFNEQNTILETIKRIPRHVENIQDIEISIVNDGSKDKTLEVIKKAGVKHIINFHKNRGLGRAFREGISYALKIDADIIVNIDADCQYRGEEIKNIIRPILEKKAGLVVGDRQLKKIEGYPLYKLMTQFIANKLVSILFNIEANDVTSGFRAFSKESANILKENLTNDYTYTLESICILAKRKMPILFSPINIRYPTRRSRLIKNKIYYVINFLVTLLRCFLIKY